jgi:demethylmenaquinone methyltransferase/2-methoxy-6-polyprenyl-1,4-benzoquinol methylase
MTQRSFYNKFDFSLSLCAYQTGAVSLWHNFFLKGVDGSMLEKEMVQSFFNSIAPRYDLMNNLVSFGRHHSWRRFLVRQAIREAPLNGESKFLDICCGTGMITLDLANGIGPAGQVIGLDFSKEMLSIAGRTPNRYGNVTFIYGNALELPFSENTFDCVTTGYGLRNVGALQRFLTEMKRVAKPGGRVISLELAKPYLPGFKQIYQIHLDFWIPLLGQILTRNRAAYQYLRDSVVDYPHQREVTKIFQEVGFDEVKCYELTWGVAAVHVGRKK